jgi:hypothetical protein
MESRLRQLCMVIGSVLVLIIAVVSVVPLEADTYIIERRHGYYVRPYHYRHYHTYHHSYSVRAVQRALSESGYRVSIDGVLGPQTRAAIRDFQYDQGLEPTGRINRATLTKLGL